MPVRSKQEQQNPEYHQYTTVWSAASIWFENWGLWVLVQRQTEGVCES